MLNSLHIELTSRCILECPACPRTIFVDKFKRPFPKFDLDNNKLIKFLDCELGKQVTHFHLEGNHGDTIYYPRLFEFIDHWRDTKSFTIYTNGSNRSKQWWEDFSNRLTENDVIVFSIDGDQHTNPLYRINSNWQSILTGVQVLVKSPAKVIWRTILFKTNEDQIGVLKEFALSMGVDEFVLELSHRFGDDEKFKPTKYIDVTTNLENKISAKCADYKLLYISANGHIAPCCWIVTFNTLHQTEFWKNKDQWSINNTNLTKFINKEQIIKFIENIEDNYNSAYTVCQHNCNVNTEAINKRV